MTKNLQVLSSVLQDSKKSSYIEKIRDVYLKHGFTDRQKRACELFLFEPTKENAVMALKLTPKAWVFVRNFLSKKDLTEVMIAIIKKENINSTYLKVLTGNAFLNDLVDQLLQTSIAEKIEKYFKIREMNNKLRR
ncbi:hypothetical protein [uncultured Brevibacillus sp.]|uniref:hypothetical protein n=1 Tax=uncultured Brevibacillus sp. TaxID=169970 RepID=UPI002596608F|nr:hypothetical protein [uncultured Brevibacillus sp.]